MLDQLVKVQILGGQLAILSGPEKYSISRGFSVFCTVRHASSVGVAENAEDSVRLCAGPALRYGDHSRQHSLPPPGALPGVPGLQTIRLKARRLKGPTRLATGSDSSEPSEFRSAFVSCPGNRGPSLFLAVASAVWCAGALHLRKTTLISSPAAFFDSQNISWGCFLVIVTLDQRIGAMPASEPQRS